MRPCPQALNTTLTALLSVSDKTGIVEFARALAALDVRLLAPLVRCPTLVMHAEGDQIVPVGLGQDLAAAIPGARFVTLPTRNHIPLAADPGFPLWHHRISESGHEDPFVQQQLAHLDRSGGLLAGLRRNLRAVHGGGRPSQPRRGWPDAAPDALSGTHP